MIRSLQYFNLFGVAALIALCIIQWRANRQVNLEITGLERTRLEQSAKLTEQEKTIKGYTADLDAFREQLASSDAALKDAQAKLSAMTGESGSIAAERDQLKANADAWKAAIADRDEKLKQANEQLLKLASERNEAVGKFNDLADKYNTLMKDLDDARAKLASANRTKSE